MPPWAHDTVRTPRHPQDADAIGVLYDEPGYPHPPESTRAQLTSLIADPNHGVWVAEVSARVVGVVEARDYRAVYLPPLVDVVGLAVSSAHRRMGAGRALIEQVASWASGRGASGIRLLSCTSRSDAHAFYESLGFVKLKEQSNYRLTL